MLGAPTMLDGPRALFWMSMAARFSAVKEEMTAERNGTLIEEVEGGACDGQVYEGGRGGQR